MQHDPAQICQIFGEEHALKTTRQNPIQIMRKNGITVDPEDNDAEVAAKLLPATLQYLNTSLDELLPEVFHDTKFSIIESAEQLYAEPI